MVILFSAGKNSDEGGSEIQCMQSSLREQSVINLLITIEV